MKKEKKMTWYDVTLKQFKELQDIFRIEDDTDRILAIAELLLGSEVVDLPFSQFNEKVKVLSFLNEPIPEFNPPKYVEVNGRKYFTDCLLGNITTAQYVDYTNHSKTEDVCKMLSVFLIPEGHKYNDGYDMEQVFKDINDLPVPFVNSTAFFFGKQFKLFMKIFQRYSIKRLKKMKLKEEEKNSLIELVNSSTAMVLYPLS